MSVKRKEMTCYSVSQGSDWATICIQYYSVPDKMSYGEHRQGVELLVHSSYGSWAYHWSHCGCDGRQFLIDGSKDYIMGKLVRQEDRYVFDPKASERALRRHILEWRREGIIGKDTARQEYDAACDLDSFLSAEEFVEALQSNTALRVIEEPWDFCRSRMCPTLDQFWDKLWVQFTAKLKEEMEDQTPRCICCKTTEGLREDRWMGHRIYRCGSPDCQVV